MSTIIGLVSTFRLPLHWCVGLDFPSPVSASNVQSARSGASVWTFQVLFLPTTSNLSISSRCFGLSAIQFLHKVHSVNLVTLFWTFRNPIPPKSPIHRL